MPGVLGGIGGVARASRLLWRGHPFAALRADSARVVGAIPPAGGWLPQGGHKGRPYDASGETPALQNPLNCGTFMAG